MLNGIANAFSDSTNNYQTSADREREKDADEVARQYSLLFASTPNVQAGSLCHQELQGYETHEGSS